MQALLKLCKGDGHFRVRRLGVRVGGKRVLNFCYDEVDPGLFAWGGASGRSREEAALRRECRGVLIQVQPTKVISRPFHKFFNVYQVEENRQDSLRVEGGMLLEKVDGMVIQAFACANAVHYLSKAGKVQARVVEFAARRPGYGEMVRELTGEGFTTLFEWCSPDHKVVVQHQARKLVLLAARDIVTGQYMHWAGLQNKAVQHGVSAVQRFGTVLNQAACYTLASQVMAARTLGDLAAITSEVPAAVEGAVLLLLRGPAGLHFIKLKTTWYRVRHAALTDPSAGAAALGHSDRAAAERDRYCRNRNPQNRVALYYLPRIVLVRALFRLSPAPVVVEQVIGTNGVARLTMLTFANKAAARAAVELGYHGILGLDPNMAHVRAHPASSGRTGHDMGEHVMRFYA